MFKKFRLSVSNKEVIINLNEIIAIEDDGFNTTKIITNGIVTVEDKSITNTTYIVDGNISDISSRLRKEKLLD